MPTCFLFLLRALGYRFSPGMGRGSVWSTSQIGSKWALCFCVLAIGILLAPRKFMIQRTTFLFSFSQWLPGWLIVCSGCFDFQGFPAPGSGGAVIAAYPNLGRLCSIEERVILYGRCLLVSPCLNIFELCRRVHIFNLHNYGLSGGQVSPTGMQLNLCSGLFD